MVKKADKKELEKEKKATKKETKKDVKKKEVKKKEPKKKEIKQPKETKLKKEKAELLKTKQGIYLKYKKRNYRLGTRSRFETIKKNLGSIVKTIDEKPPTIDGTTDNKKNPIPYTIPLPTGGIVRPYLDDTPIKETKDIIKFIKDIDIIKESIKKTEEKKEEEKKTPKEEIKIIKEQEKIESKPPEIYEIKDAINELKKIDEEIKAIGKTNDPTLLKQLENLKELKQQLQMTIELQESIKKAEEKKEKLNLKKISEQELEKKKIMLNEHLKLKTMAYEKAIEEIKKKREDLNKMKKTDIPEETKQKINEEIKKDKKEEENIKELKKEVKTKHEEEMEKIHNMVQKKYPTKPMMDNEEATKQLTYYMELVDKYLKRQEKENKEIEKKQREEELKKKKEAEEEEKKRLKEEKKKQTKAEKEALKELETVQAEEKRKKKEAEEEEELAREAEKQLIKEDKKKLKEEEKDQIKKEIGRNIREQAIKSNIILKGTESHKDKVLSLTEQKIREKEEKKEKENYSERMEKYYEEQGKRLDELKSIASLDQLADIEILEQEREKLRLRQKQEQDENKKKEMEKMINEYNDLVKMVEEEIIKMNEEKKDEIINLGNNPPIRQDISQEALGELKQEIGVVQQIEQQPEQIELTPEEEELAKEAEKLLIKEDKKRLEEEEIGKDIKDIFDQSQKEQDEADQRREAIINEIDKLNKNSNNLKVVLTMRADEIKTLKEKIDNNYKILNKKNISPMTRDKYIKLIKADQETVDQYMNDIQTIKTKIEDNDKLIMELQDKLDLEGKGEGEPSKGGLYDTQINDYMKNYKNKGFIGCYAYDEIDRIRFKKNPPPIISFIANTENRGSNVVGHWISVIIDNVNNNIEYYDSFGEEPKKGFIYKLKKMLKNVPYQLKINRIKQQSISSANCGYFCMDFIKKRIGDKKTFSQATGFDKFIKLVDNSKKGEQDIKKFKKNILQFGKVKV